MSKRPDQAFEGYDKYRKAAKKGRAFREGMTTEQVAFVQGYDGDTHSTCDRLGIDRAKAAHWAAKDWFIAALKDRQRQELLTIKRDRAVYLENAILARAELQSFWSSIIADDDWAEGSRLKASELLAKSLGELSDKTEVTLVGDEAKPVCVKKVDLDERIAFLGGRRSVMDADWLSAS